VLYGAALSALPSSSPERRRIAALDAARALGVVAMVFGHTLDALLGSAARASPAVVAYWKARGFTAPLFLVVAGWAVTVVIARSGARGLAVPRARLGRVLLLLAVGCALRWPGWGLDRLLAGDRDVWAHLLAFDALHTIALAILATAAVLALPLRTRERGLLLAALAVLAVALGMSAPAPLPPAPRELPRSIAAIAAWQAMGGTSPFPVFPWAAYFLAGALVGLLAGDGAGRRAAAMAAVGGAAVLATFWTGVGTMPPGHPVLFPYRVGVVLLVLAALALVPAGLARLVAPLGRASLGVYALHVPLVYGWSGHAGLAGRLGPTLSVGAALGVAAAVLAASFAAHHAIAAGWRAARGALRGQRADAAAPRNASARASAQ
jgi:acyltransferase